MNIHQDLFDSWARKIKEEDLSGSGMIGLGELYDLLKELPKDAPVGVEYMDEPFWAGDLISYRGFYEDLSFDVEGCTSVEDVLEQIDDYLSGESYEGYKGGEYYAHRGTLVWVSQYGYCSGLGVTGVELVGSVALLRTVDTNDR